MVVAGFCDDAESEGQTVTVGTALGNGHIYYTDYVFGYNTGSGSVSFTQTSSSSAAGVAFILEAE